MWQKCPICQGSGISPIAGTYTNVPICPTCNGARIISEINGLPPPINPPELKSNTTNVDINNGKKII